MRRAGHLPVIVPVATTPVTVVVPVATTILVLMAVVISVTMVASSEATSSFTFVKRPVILATVFVVIVASSVGGGVATSSILLLSMEVMVVTMAVVATTAIHASATSVASAVIIPVASMAHGLLAIGRNDCWLILVLALARAHAMAMLTLVGATVLATTEARRTSSLATFLRLSLLDVHSTSVDLSHRLVLDKMLRNGLLYECDETKATRGAIVTVLENDGILDLSMLLEMLL